MASIEIPKYQVTQKKGAIEIRSYASMIVAEVEVEGDRSEAVKAGFRLLADYIFGNNTSRQSIAMTAPVIQQPSEKIAMTSPVNQIRSGNLWKVQFRMPSRYTLETLPKPNNPRVQIKSVSAHRTAAIRFSGFWSQKNLKKNSEKLLMYMREHRIQAAGDPIYAFYNPPWTLPFLRRNEVIYNLQKE